MIHRIGGNRCGDFDVDGRAAIYRRDEDRYSSNLTDAEWERPKPLIPEASDP
jgi:hypothetical protein